MNEVNYWDEILRSNAASYARVALTSIEREFPSDVYLTMTRPDDFPRRPHDRSPVFYGSFDWHSCMACIPTVHSGSPVRFPIRAGAGPTGRLRTSGGNGRRGTRVVFQ